MRGIHVPFYLEARGRARKARGDHLGVALPCWCVSMIVRPIVVKTTTDAHVAIAVPIPPSPPRRKKQGSCKIIFRLLYAMAKLVLDGPRE